MGKRIDWTFWAICGIVGLFQGFLTVLGGCTEILYTLTVVEETVLPRYSYEYPAYTECEYLIDWVWYYGACGMVH